MRMDPQQDKGEQEQVVDDEVRAHICCMGNIFGIIGEQIIQIADLQNEEDNPDSRLGRSTAWEPSPSAVHTYQ